MSALLPALLPALLLLLALPALLLLLLRVAGGASVCTSNMCIYAPMSRSNAL
jgi:hypothetical protein